MRFDKISIILILTVFVILGIYTINLEQLYTPDSAEFIILAKAISSGEGYRDISSPGSPSILVTSRRFHPLAARRRAASTGGIR